MDRPKWTGGERTKERLDEHIAAWADYLGLGSWEIAFSPLEPEPDARAQSNPHVELRRAVLRFEPTTPDSQMDRHVVHELLHVLLMEAEDLFDRAAEANGPHVVALLNTKWRHATEWAIERLVTALTGTERQDYDVGPGREVWSSAFPVRDG